MDDLDRLAAAVPAPVREVCEALAAAGHEAYTVGGAVRDVLLGREPGDWDVATSARPEDVVGLFRRTIPTGLEHGTVTVMAGRGAARTAVEVTTFRGEGAYSDARRPDEVVFGVPLNEDLARRDFVVNAIAFDPVTRTLRDPFGGVDDLAARRLRAVGVARDRFLEDGLRVMRAVRFVSTLDFGLDAETEAAIPEALPSLAKVSQERVRVELHKLLAGVAPRRALEIARRRGVLDVVLPELSAVDWPLALARMEAAPGDAVLRLAALCVEVEPEALDAALRRLTFSNADRERAVIAARFGRAWEPPPATDVELRRRLAAIGRSALGDVLAMWSADSAARGRPPEAEAVIDRARAIAARGDALSVRELAVGGGELLRELGMAPGPAVGKLLAALFERVLDDPSRNHRDALLELAREISAS